ncbi:MAG: histidine kinase dimerization/phosphoacceptor domain-containing protein, partial [Nocardioides sp.]
MTVVADLWGDAHGPGRRAVLVDVAVGASFAVVVAFIQLQLLSWTWPAAVLLGVALAVRRVTPLVMVGVAVLASVSQLLVGHVAFVACTAYVPLFVALGGHRDARLRRLGLASAIIAVVIASAWAWSQSDQDGTTSGRLTSTVALGAPTAVLVLGGWAIGYLRWQRRQAVQARADATVQSVERRRLGDLYEQEQERGRIAADMHDLVAHSWAVVAAQADGARYVVRDDPDRA